ncbi:hypothetical protein ACJX0J_008942, partial [Zea mays]
LGIVSESEINSNFGQIQGLKQTNFLDIFSASLSHIIIDLHFNIIRLAICHCIHISGGDDSLMSQPNWSTIIPEDIPFIIHCVDKNGGKMNQLPFQQEIKMFIQHFAQL